MNDVHFKRYLINMAQVLDIFAEETDRKLITVEQRLYSAKMGLSLLKERLRSVELSELAEVEEQVEEQKPALPEATEPDFTHEDAPVVEELPGIAAKDHPRYKKFFKLVAIGANLMEIKQRMAIEGHDPSILNNPEARILD